MLDKFFVNGEVKPIAEANISLLNIEYCYGFGVYENIRVSKGITYFANQHAKRLLKSAEVIGLTHSYYESKILEAIDKLTAELDEDTYNLKMMLIGGEELKLIILPLAPKFPDRKWYKTGVKVVTYPYERQFISAKNLNMLGSYLAFKKAKEEEAYDALLVHKDGSIPEGTRTNLFGIKGKTLITPPDDQVLIGVTRTNVIKVATENGFEVKYEPITKDSISEFDNLFVTSTSSKIMPVRFVDDTELKEPGESLKDLMKLFDDFLGSIT